MTYRRTDGGDCNIPFAFLKKQGDNNSIVYCQKHKVRVLVFLVRTSGTF